MESLFANYTAHVDAVGGSIMLSALVGLIPLLSFFICLIVFKLRSHWSALCSLIVAIIIAVVGFKMPAGLAVMSATQGMAYGLMPIMWIVIAAIWLYQITAVSKRSEDMKKVFGLICADDLRIEAIMIAFCFGGILEALAGFGAPVAIVCAILVSLGLPPIRAAIITLVANTAPVAFGAMAAPIIAAGGLLAGEDKAQNAQYVANMVAHIMPWISFVVPTLLAALLDGKRGVKQLWPITMVVGLAFAVMQFVGATYISFELGDIISSLSGMAAALVFLKFWKPSTPDEHKIKDAEGISGSQIIMALFPYLIVIVIFAIAKLVAPVTAWLASFNIKIAWPLLHGHILTASGEVSSSTIYTLPLLSSPGTSLAVTAIIVAIVYSLKTDNGKYPMTFGRGMYCLVEVIVKNRFAILTVALILGLAYVMNFSGETVSIGAWLAGLGTFYLFVSPVLGFIGTAVTGSDTSANALFTTLQETAANKLGVSPYVTAAANTCGGVIGKLISPQNLTIAATAIEKPGSEPVLFKGVIAFAIGMLLAVCVITFILATVIL